MRDRTEPQETLRRRHVLPLSVKLGYASGNLGKSIQWNTVDFLYLYFLTDLIGISPTLAGLIILASLVWDGVSDPLAGYLIDRLGGRIGSYQSLILFFAPIAMLGFLAIFILPLVAPGSVVAWALLAGLLFRTGYTLVDVPHNALLADVTRDSRERTVLSAYRFFFSSLGSIVLSLAVFPALMADDGVSTDRFLIFAGLMGGVYLAVMCASALSSRGVGSRSKRPSEPTSLATALRRLAGNQQLRLIAGIVAVTALLVPIFAKMSIYYAKTQLEAPEAATTLIIAYALGQLVSLPAWLAISNLTEKRDAALLANLLLMLVCVGFWFDRPDFVWSAGAWFAMAGFAFGGINTMNWAMIPDTVEYTEARSSARHEALTFGLLLLIMKVFTGLSMLLSGWALEVSGYDRDAQITQSTTNGIVQFMTIAPLLGTVVCGLLLLALSISHAGHMALRSNGKETP